MAELAQHPAERTDPEGMDILRWEDDGGPTFEHEHPADNSTPDVTLGDNQLMRLPAKEELGRLWRR